VLCGVAPGNGGKGGPPDPYRRDEPAVVFSSPGLGGLGGGVFVLGISTGIISPGRCLGGSCGGAAWLPLGPCT
jgi:hypothetical protein